MNFFEHQDNAKKKTLLLVLLLIVAVMTLIAITIITVGIFLYYFQAHSTSIQAYQTYNSSLLNHFNQLLQSNTLLYVVVSVVSVVGLGSLYKWLKLTQGGKYIAESLGGQLIQPNTQDKQQRKVLNTVEEMALASGNPVPTIYLLKDHSINAFAAGLSRRDAVIGVTQGCIDLLDRDELQGVMAHEFSHIHNGDMRLNMRLIACLHGILVIGLIGSFIIRGSSGYRHSRHRNKNRGQQMIFGLALVAIGYGGTFFGNMIKAAVSRQREFLADASAVQFTRNPFGISKALQKIGGLSHGSMIDRANTAEFSHLFFGQGIQPQFTALMSTHPPLSARIRRIDPRWNGRFSNVQQPDNTSTGQPAEQSIDKENQNSCLSNVHNPNNLSNHLATSQLAKEHLPNTEPLHPILNNASSLHYILNDDIIERMGMADEKGLATIQKQLQQLPTILIESAHEPFSACALVYCLLIDNNKNIREKQSLYLQQNIERNISAEMEKLRPIIDVLSDNFRLLLIELSMPALKLLSTQQHKSFIQHLAQLIKADKQVTLFEWCLYRIIRSNLAEKHYSETKSLKQCRSSIEVLLSAVVSAGKNKKPNDAFTAGVKVLKISTITLINGYSLKAIDDAFDELNQLKPLQKPILLRAIMASINTDKLVTVQEAELFRAIADTINCPVPPIYATA
jgi:Zn-dependent protease with chaperone function